MPYWIAKVSTERRRGGKLFNARHPVQAPASQALLDDPLIACVEKDEQGIWREVGKPSLAKAPSPPAPLPEGEKAPSPPAPLPEGEGGKTFSPPAPDEAPSPPAPLPEGEGGKTSRRRRKVAK